MSPLALVLVIILIVVLLGGVGPMFYQGAPWRPGYGFGGSVNGLIVLILIVVIILWAMGRM
jgi:hypothetical protein